MSRKEVKFQVKEHRETGLLMAISDDLPGFVLHAHSDDELMQKLGPELEAFMDAIGCPVKDVEVRRDEASPGFWPPAYIAKAEMSKAA